ncbi:16897_t:CDS:2, partial [Gigaspora rosea]
NCSNAFQGAEGVYNRCIPVQELKFKAAAYIDNLMIGIASGAEW